MLHLETTVIAMDQIIASLHVEVKSLIVSHILLRQGLVRLTSKLQTSILHPSSDAFRQMSDKKLNFQPVANAAEE